MKALIKFALSFFKSDWKLEDYPVKFKHSPSDGSGATGRWAPAPWYATIINWRRMFGAGDTQEEAYDALRRRFQEYKREGKRLPRPGTGLPMELTSTAKVGRHEEIARDFLAQILDLDFDRCFISDETSLWDFAMLETDESFESKIEKVYGVDVSDIEDGNLVKIFARIAEGAGSV